MECRDSGSEAGVLRIDPLRVQNTGIVSTTAEMAVIVRHGRSVGIRDVNADNITRASTRFEGWIVQAPAKPPEPGH